jgi:hypothetical protein
VIWEPFVLAVILGLVVSAGLYFAYLWPSVDPVTETEAETAPVAELDASPDPAEPKAAS